MVFVSKFDVPESTAASPVAVPQGIEEAVAFCMNLVDGEAVVAPETAKEAAQIVAAASAWLAEGLTLEVIESFERAMEIRPLAIGVVRASVPWVVWRCAVHVGLCYTLYPEIALSKDEQAFLDTLVEVALP